MLWVCWSDAVYSVRLHINVDCVSEAGVNSQPHTLGRASVLVSAVRTVGKKYRRLKLLPKLKFSSKIINNRNVCFN